MSDITNHDGAVRARYAAAAERLADVPTEHSGLSCGTPVADIDLRPGEVVLDLGSGAGRDVLAAARRVGPAGRAIGLDMTPGMLDLARRHATEQRVANAEFHQGRIEDMPLPDASVDVVVSNCVITLSPDKPRVFAEIARVLRPGGRVSISDVLAEFDLTDAERAANADRIECLTGSLTVDQYAANLTTAGLTGVRLRRGEAMDGKLFAATVTAVRGMSIGQVMPMMAEHADQVVAIYQAGLATRNASFETTAPSWAQWDSTHRPEHRFVALDRAGAVLGWVAAVPVSNRCVYAGVLEHSIYVDPEHQGRGVGRALLNTYIAATEGNGIWTLQTGIFPENPGSLALHERAGFRVVGRRERIGQHHGIWRDVILVERRSPRLHGVGHVQTNLGLPTK